MSETFFGFCFGDDFRVFVFGDFDMIATAGAFDIGAIDAVDNHDVAPVGEDRVDFLLVERKNVVEGDGVGVEVFDRDVVFAGFEVGAEGAVCGNELSAVLGSSKRAGQGGEGKLSEGLF